LQSLNYTSNYSTPLTHTLVYPHTLNAHPLYHRHHLVYLQPYLNMPCGKWSKVKDHCPRQRAQKEKEKAAWERQQYLQNFLDLGQFVGIDGLMHRVVQEGQKLPVQTAPGRIDWLPQTGYCPAREVWVSSAVPGPEWVMFPPGYFSGLTLLPTERWVLDGYPIDTILSCMHDVRALASLGGGATNPSSVDTSPLSGGIANEEQTFDAAAAPVLDGDDQDMDFTVPTWMPEQGINYSDPAPTDGQDDFDFGMPTVAATTDPSPLGASTGMPAYDPVPFGTSTMPPANDPFMGSDFKLIDDFFDLTSFS